MALDGWRRALKKGDIIDAMDADSRWFDAVVMEVTGEKIQVHFRGWPRTWDRWMNKYDETSIQQLFTRTDDWRRLRSGDLCEMCDGKEWYMAGVVDVIPATAEDDQAYVDVHKVIEHPSMCWRLATSSEFLCQLGTHLRLAVDLELPSAARADARGDVGAEDVDDEEEEKENEKESMIGDKWLTILVVVAAAFLAPFCLMGGRNLLRYYWWGTYLFTSEPPEWVLRLYLREDPSMSCAFVWGWTLQKNKTSPELLRHVASRCGDGVGDAYLESEVLLLSAFRFSAMGDNGPGAELLALVKPKVLNASFHVNEWSIYRTYQRAGYDLAGSLAFAASDRARVLAKDLDEDAAKYMEVFGVVNDGAWSYVAELAEVADAIEGKETNASAPLFGLKELIAYACAAHADYDRALDWIFRDLEHHVTMDRREYYGRTLDLLARVLSADGRRYAQIRSAIMQAIDAVGGSTTDAAFANVVQTLATLKDREAGHRRKHREPPATTTRQQPPTFSAPSVKEYWELGYEYTYADAFLKPDVARVVSTASLVFYPLLAALLGGFWVLHRRDIRRRVEQHDTDN